MGRVGFQEALVLRGSHIDFAKSFPKAQNFFKMAYVTLAVTTLVLLEVESDNQSSIKVHDDWRKRIADNYHQFAMDFVAIELVRQDLHEFPKPNVSAAVIDPISSSGALFNCSSIE
jgi:hypothetical protein